MKKIIIGLILLLVISCLLVGCNEDEWPQKINPLAYTDAIENETADQNETEDTTSNEASGEREVVVTKYVYEKEGAGGEFALYIKDDGTFDYYEGYLSSHLGHGTWTAEGNEFHLMEGNQQHYYFYLEDCDLKFIADYSDNFHLVDVADGEKFLFSETFTRIYPNIPEATEATESETTKSEDREFIETKYVYEKDVSSGCVIYLRDDGTFYYWESTVSSSHRGGTWTAEGNELHLVEPCPTKEYHYYFWKNKDGDLEFIADYSDNFCKVADGEKFILSDK